MRLCCFIVFPCGHRWATFSSSKHDHGPGIKSHAGLHGCPECTCLTQAPEAYYSPLGTIDLRAMVTWGV